MPLRKCSECSPSGHKCELTEGHPGPHSSYGDVHNQATRCDYFFYPANHPQDWMKDSALIRCGRYKGHEGHHWPVPIPQSANAGKDQAAKESLEERLRQINHWPVPIPQSANVGMDLPTNESLEERLR